MDIFDVPRKKPKTACIISLTSVTDEPRVRRQSHTLHEAGWNVVVAGYKGRSEKPPYWRLIEVEQVYPALSTAKRLGLQLKKRLCPYHARYAEDYYWWAAGFGGIFERIAWVEGVKCDLVVAHDYYTAPIAARLADKCGAKFVVDCHEYAVEQYAYDPEWMRVERPWIDVLQRRFLGQAAAVTTVCEGIARLLARDYDLAVPPLVVRSVPAYQELPFRPVDGRVEVLYHGIISPHRGLEVTIKSVPLWRPEFRFVIRGPGPEDYVASLRALAAECGVAGRVRIEPPVPFSEIVPAANRSDIGFFVQEDVSLHKHFALPNKFFEYIMAGMALCVADLPEMARIVTKHGVGRLVQTITREGIAETINGFSAHDIDEYKRRSLKAARELCWEKESESMLAVYEKAI